MTTDMTWSNTELDHVKPICMFAVCKHEELKEAFKWKKTQASSEKDHQQNGIKFSFLDYQLQIIIAYQFIKLNEEGPN